MKTISICVIAYLILLLSVTSIVAMTAVVLALMAWSVAPLTILVSWPVAGLIITFVTVMWIWFTIEEKPWKM